jgi:hypothetical protein
MRRVSIVIPFFLIILACCKKNDSPRLSGTDTIDNILYGTGPYYALGFSFPESKKVSTLNNPIDVITINADIAVDGSIRMIYFATGNFDNSFFLFGEYNDSATAASAFNNLTSFSEPQCTALGIQVKMNQIWLYRTSLDKHVKIRTISTVAEKRDNKPYAECAFEWVYQPDGSLTFPGK